MGNYNLKGKLVYTSGSYEERDVCKIVLSTVVKGMVFTKDVEIIIKQIEKKKEVN